jgi:hypothetical protein
MMVLNLLSAFIRVYLRLMMYLGLDLSAAIGG